nr:MAG: transcription initiation factor TFIIB [uncultured archaeon]
MNNRCKECNETLTQNSFERVCPNCGLVDSSILHNSLAVIGKIPSEINHSPSRSYQYVSIANTLIDLSNLGSIIKSDHRGFRDINGHKIPIHNNRYFNRLNRCKNIYMNNEHGNENRFLTTLERVCRYLSISQSIRCDIAYIFKKITKNEVVPNKVVCLSFCVYYIIKKNHPHLGITIHDIANAFNQIGHRTSPKSIIRQCFEFKKYIKQNKPVSLKHYIEKGITFVCESNTIEKRLEIKGFGNSIEIYRKMLLETSNKIMNIVIKTNSGKRYSSLASSIIYTADIVIARKNKHKKVLTQKTLGKYLNIPEYTIRDCYSNFLKPLIVSKLK